MTDFVKKAVMGTDDYHEVMRAALLALAGFKPKNLTGLPYEDNIARRVVGTHGYVTYKGFCGACSSKLNRVMTNHIGLHHTEQKVKYQSPHDDSICPMCGEICI